MLTTRLFLAGALVFLPASAQVSTGAPTGAIQTIAPHQHAPITDRKEHGDGTAESSNWSGYAVTGSSFTSAKGSWIVEAANCSGVSGDQYTSFWVGLDGYSSNTVEQTGTDSDCDGGNPDYYAWYEFYPNPSFLIPAVPIAVGNVMTASVVYSGGEFTITITNETTGKSFTKTGAVPPAKRTSAEWITEAPCCARRGGILPLSDFGTVSFGLDYTKVAGTNDATDGTQSGPIGSFPATGIEQISKTATASSPQLSTCSALSSDGSSFTCTWAQ